MWRTALLSWLRQVSFSKRGAVSVASTGDPTAVCADSRSVASLAQAVPSPGVICPSLRSVSAETCSLPKFSGVINAPAQQLLGVMNAVGRNLAVVVDQGVKENKFSA